MLSGRNRLGMNTALSILSAVQFAGSAFAADALAGKDANSPQSETKANSATSPENVSKHDGLGARGALKHKLVDGMKNAPIMFASDNEAEADSTKQPTADQIGQANTLHAQALEALNGGDVKKAVEIERKAVAAAPTYWLPRAALAVMLYKDGEKLQAVSAASFSVRFKHESVADRNFARLLENMNWVAMAITQFDKDIKDEPDNEQARVGLASCYVLTKDEAKAKKALQDVRDMNSKQFETLYLTGFYALELGDAVSAKSDLQKAVELASSADEKRKAQKRLFLAAIRSGDLQLATELQSQLAPEDTKKYKLEYVEAQINAAPKFEDVLAIVNPLKEDQNVEYQTLFGLAKDAQTKAITANATQKERYLQLAADLYLAADKKEIKDDPDFDKVPCKLALAGIYDQLGKRKEALDQLQVVAGLIGKDETTKAPRAQARLEPLTRHLNAKGPLLLECFSATGDGNYTSSVRLAKLTMPSPKCNCHKRAAERMMVTQPGVLFAAFVDKTNQIFVLYDAKKQNSGNLFRLKELENIQETLVLDSDNALNSLAQVIAAMKVDNGGALNLRDFEYIELAMPQVAQEKVASDSSTSN
jgi:Flp pilus assembly protein TadD